MIEASVAMNLRPNAVPHSLSAGSRPVWVELLRLPTVARDVQRCAANCPCRHRTHDAMAAHLLVEPAGLAGVAFCPACVLTADAKLGHM